MSKTIISYVRVSTAGQGRSGLGLEAQRQAIAQFCKAQSYTIGAEYLEVEIRQRRRRARTSPAARRRHQSRPQDQGSDRGRQARQVVPRRELH